MCDERPSDVYHFATGQLDVNVIDIGGHGVKHQSVISLIADAVDQMEHLFLLFHRHFTIAVATSSALMLVSPY